MKQYNPVREGLKKHPSSHAYYLTLKERAKNGLTAIELDWYRARQKAFEPEVYEAEMAAGERRVAMDYARKLSTDDLMAVLSERDTPALMNETTAQRDGYHESAHMLKNALRRAEAERDRWRDLATRLAKQHEPYVPLFPSDEVRRRTVSGSILDEIYRLNEIDGPAVPKEV